MNSVSLSRTYRSDTGCQGKFRNVSLGTCRNKPNCIENNGHCYLELIEKMPIRMVFWQHGYAGQSVFRMLKPYFESSTGESLRAGLNVLVAVTVEFSGLYGFSLNVRGRPSLPLANWQPAANNPTAGSRRHCRYE